MEEQIDEQPQEQPVVEKSYEILELEREELLKRVQSGANWFFWVAGLSFINSLMIAGHKDISFIAGLGLTQMVDGLVIGVYGQHHTIATIINAAIAGMFVLIGIRARKAGKTAFIIGLSVYALDALIFMYFEAWKEFIFHGFAFYFMFMGYKTIQEYNEIQDKMALDHLVTNTEDGV